MKGYKRYIMVRCASSIFMMTMLVWLTVSAPFVTSFQSKMRAFEKEKQKTAANACNDKDDSGCNPFANATEEKTGSGSVSFSEEYLHEYHELIHTNNDLLKHDNCGHSTLYIAFHGELLSPPPEV